MLNLGPLNWQADSYPPYYCKVPDNTLGLRPSLAQEFGPPQKLFLIQGYCLTWSYHPILCARPTTGQWRRSRASVWNSSAGPDQPQGSTRGWLRPPWQQNQNSKSPSTFLCVSALRVLFPKPLPVKHREFKFLSQNRFLGSWSQKWVLKGSRLQWILKLIHPFSSWLTAGAPALGVGWG